MANISVALPGDWRRTWDDVSEHCKLGNTSMLELSGAVLVKLLLIDVGGEIQGIKVASRLKNTCQ